MKQRHLKDLWRENVFKVFLIVIFSRIYVYVRREDGSVARKFWCSLLRTASVNIAYTSTQTKLNKSQHFAHVPSVCCFLTLNQFQYISDDNNWAVFQFYCHERIAKVIKINSCLIGNITKYWHRSDFLQSARCNIEWCNTSETLLFVFLIVYYSAYSTGNI